MLKSRYRLSQIQPGKPQQNACAERYNRTIWHERLNWEVMRKHRRGTGIRHAMAMSLQHEQPNMGIGGITPAEKLAV
ncbi:integrase core domain-containing protein [Rhizobium sp. NPDC090279]|uniref:integrase core domain-containing protein n=1 Tax=Rhizobium sp. NPDC090279 TaxID=3364499 RepID=UPI003839EA30